MLLFLLAFMYADQPYYDHERIICMAQYLINVQAKNRLEQKGLLKRFNVNCYGKEKTMVEIRGDKSSKFKELKNAVDSKEYNKYFFKYIPNKTKKKRASYIVDDTFIQPNNNKKYKNYNNNNRPFKRTRKNNVVRRLIDNIF